MEFSQLFIQYIQRNRHKPRRYNNSQRATTSTSSLSIDRIRPKDHRVAHFQIRRQLRSSNLVRRVLRLVQQPQRRVRSFPAHRHRRQWPYWPERIQRCFTFKRLLVSARFLRVHCQQDLQAYETIGHSVRHLYPSGRSIRPVVSRVQPDYIYASWHTREISEE